MSSDDQPQARTTGQQICGGPEHPGSRAIDTTAEDAAAVQDPGVGPPGSSTPHPGRAGSGAGARLRGALLAPYSSAALGLVAFCIYLSITQPVFLTLSNWQNILRTSAVTFILALGVTFVVLTGGIDLSVTAMLALSTMIFGILMKAGLSWVAALAVTIAFGLLLGLINGILIGAARLSFFVVTLGALSVYTAVALLVTGGNTVSLYTYSQFASVEHLANNNVGPIPAAALVVLALYIVGSIVLHYTPFGRSVYSVGSNVHAARLNGLRVGLVLTSVYAVGGAAAGLAAVIQAGRLGAAAPQTDPTLLLTVIAAVLIGGTLYTGGEGGLLGTAIGVLFLAVIQNGLILTSVSTYWQGVVSGLILVVAIALTAGREQVQQWRRRIRARRTPDRRLGRPAAQKDV